MKNWNWMRNENANTNQENSPVASSTKNPTMRTAYFAPLTSFRQEMDRVFDQAFRGFGMPSVFGGSDMSNMIFNPCVDISSTDKEYIIEVEVPGMSKNDICLDITREGELCICGEKNLDNSKQEKNFHRVERSYGSFSRTLSLPEDVDRENIQASFNNGLLTISLPRVPGQNTQSRRIEVKEGTSSHHNKEQSAEQNNTNPYPPAL